MTDIYRQIDQLLLRSQRILLIGHQRPDEDTLGANLSFYIYLKSLGKEVKVYTADIAPSYLHFMPGIDEVTCDKSVFDERWDLYFFLDCGSISNTRLDEELFKGKAILNIDHHISNNSYGLVNLIDAKASSTCEIAYNYFLAIGYPIDKRVATNLLAGILGDTSGFIHNTTKSETIKIASELIKVGIKIHQIFNYVVRNKTIEGLRLWGEILSRIKFNKELNIAYTYIFDDDFKNHRVKEDELDGLANFLNAIVDVNATALFRISPNRVKASWRTKREDIDLLAFCSQFGGGGHKKASGFTVNWQVVEKDGELIVI
ncbi:MAG: bifunctional oligoribonuclease/PAP phosphatase NrnA [Candidatus Buchananbacteria bacterium]